MMFTHAEHVQAHLIGELDPPDQMPDALRPTDRLALAIVR